ncbi:hypothetical protein ACFOHY_18370 [Rhizobium rosettiformans]
MGIPPPLLFRKMPSRSVTLAAATPDQMSSLQASRDFDIGSLRDPILL